MGSGDITSHLDTVVGRRVALIGDLMLDRYIMGEVNRISPEAPVPVLHVRSHRVVAGGAANVAANLAALGLRVDIVGLVGDDAARHELVAALGAYEGCDCSGLVVADTRQTTQKLRVIGAHQQIVRVDQEDAEPLDAALEALCIDRATAAIDAADVVVISDYGKGVCTDGLLRRVIDHARSVDKPIIVDPKRRDLAAYAGATILTPNRRELSEATGLPCESDAEAETAARAAQTVSGAAILLTRSEKGMSFFPTEGPPAHLATVAQDVFDVSGAGDTVVAVLAAALAGEIPLLDGIRMANHAAGIVVSKLGTASVSRAELSAALAAEHVAPDVLEQGLLDRDALVAQRWAWARDKLTVGFANGCFDLLHPGHIGLLRQAAEQCDRLVVALNSDASVRRLKGPTRPVQDEKARAVVMAAIKGVAAVTIFDEDTPLQLIKALQPDLLIKGADYTIDTVIGADIVHQRGGRVFLAELSPGQSTSRLVALATR